MQSGITTMFNHTKFQAVRGLVIAVAVVLGLSWVSSIPVTMNMEWYSTLQKPALNPAPWVFGVVWPILYVLMTCSAWLIWQEHQKIRDAVEEALALFIFQLVANFFWPLFFFGMQSPWLGLLWIGLVWLLVSLTVIFFAAISRKAAVLLVPYWLWVCFASYLSYSIWTMNG
ncbi:MAG: tryptophan-rich sensory protein [Alphaproteobacteria bacterium]|nr:tryptophan-rich sensory protein [Alphaproteobacteria bacterium]